MRPGSGHASQSSGLSGRRRMNLKLPSQDSGQVVGTGLNGNNVGANALAVTSQQTSSEYENRINNIIMTSARRAAE